MGKLLSAAEQNPRLTTPNQAIEPLPYPVVKIHQTNTYVVDSQEVPLARNLVKETMAQFHPGPPHIQAQVLAPRGKSCPY